MQYFDKIDVSEEIDVNKTSESKECDLIKALSFNQMSAIDIMVYS